MARKKSETQPTRQSIRCVISPPSGLPPFSRGKQGYFLQSPPLRPPTDCFARERSVPMARRPAPDRVQSTARNRNRSADCRRPQLSGGGGRRCCWSRRWSAVICFRCRESLPENACRQPIRIIAARKCVRWCCLASAWSDVNRTARAQNRFVAERGRCSTRFPACCSHCCCLCCPMWSFPSSGSASADVARVQPRCVRASGPLRMQSLQSVMAERNGPPQPSETKEASRRYSPFRVRRTASSVLRALSGQP